MRALFLLVLALAAGGMAAAAAADTAAMYTIAKKAQIQLEIEVGPEETAQVSELLELGTELVEAIPRLGEAEAKAHFLSAMHLFAEAFHILYENSGPEETGSDASARLARQERHYGQLEYLASVHEVSVNATRMDSLFARAHNQTSGGGTHAMEAIDRELDFLREQIALAATVKDRELVLEYAGWYVGHLGRLLANSEMLGIPDGDQAKLAGMRDRLQNTTNTYAILVIINNVISIKHDLNLANYDRLEVWIRQAEDRVNNLWLDGLIDDITHDVIGEWLVMCRYMLEDGEMDETEALLGKIDNWLIGYQSKSQ